MSDIAIMLEEAREHSRHEAVNTFKNLMLDKLKAKRLITTEELEHYVKFVAEEMLKENK